MKRFIDIHTAIKHCDESETIIPSAFLSVIPNNLGINLCAVKGFNIDIQEDGQFNSIEIVFMPAPKSEIQHDHTWALDALEAQAQETKLNN